MQNVTFHNVVVQGNADKQPWGDKHYDCENVQGVATGTTSPVSGNFDIIWDHFARISQLYATPHENRKMLHEVPMRMGC